MAKHRVCPWWLGYFLLSPIRRWLGDPVEAVISYVQEGMTVLEPGPGMGFFTLGMARRVGPAGRVIAPDVQPKMLKVLKRRAEKEGLGERVEARLVQPDTMALNDVAGRVDFALASAVVHEFPSPANFFQEVSRALKQGGRLLLLEPKGHVGETRFAVELDDAARAGLRVAERPAFKRSHAALLEKL